MDYVRKYGTWQRIAGVLCACTLLAILALALQGSYSSGAAGRGDVTSHMETILQGLQHRENLLTSLRGEYSTVRAETADPLLDKLVKPYRLPSQEAARTDFKFAWADCRWWQQAHDQDGERPHHEVVAFDGEKGYVFSPGEQLAWEVRNADVLQVARPEFGSWFGVSHAYDPTALSLSGLLRQKGARLTGTDMILARECFRLDAPADEYGVVRSWWVAPDLGYLLVKDQATHPWRGSAPQDPAHMIVATVRETMTEAIQESGGLMMPRVLVVTSYTLLSDGTRLRSGDTRVSVEGLEVNPSLPPEAFRIQYPVGTRVNLIGGNSYVVP